MTDEQANDETRGESLEEARIAPESADAAANVTPEAAPPGAAEGVPPPSAAELPVVEELPGWRPADYYAAPRRSPAFPRWVPLTCGVVAIVAVVLLAGIGAFLQSGGLAKLVAIAFGQLNAEAERMFDEGVAPGARTEFRKSLLDVRDAIADGTLELPAALPLLQEMQKATRDKRLSPDEVEELTSSFRSSLAGSSGEEPAEPATVDL